jgi:hypothetical protein
MKYTIATPCDNCPFRKDIAGYLRSERVREICESLFRGQSFPCHKTTEVWEDEDGESNFEATDDSQQCAGAEIFLAHQGQSTQMSRIAERMGMKVAKLNMKAPVCKSVSEMLRVHGDEEDDDRESCSVCDEDCEAPAGYAVGDGVLPGEGNADYTCYHCGEPVCGACSKIIKRKRTCNNCAESTP